VFVAHNARFWRSETDLRLSQEIRRIEHERTAGELGPFASRASLPAALRQVASEHRLCDIDVTRLLLRRYRAGALKLMPVEAQPAAACAAITSATHAVRRFA
jgi:hypothetical protein